MRGQLFSFDFLLAISIILFIFALSMFVSENTASSINRREAEFDIQRAADSALSQLVETPGNPTNWHTPDFTDANVKSIGIAASRNELDPDKTSRLFFIANSNFGNYSLVKRILALDLPSSNFSIAISNASKYAIFETMVSPAGTASVHSFSRIAIFENEPVLVNLRMWVEK
ncbi:MAG: hypothetical protein AABX01_03410 [Candidatus Micrarchaeota archaeon]